MQEHIEAVQRMQDYILSHLYEEITLADLAKVTYYSPWHAYRLFTQWLGHSPADYIRRLRLSQSAVKLWDGTRRVADVAFEVGFASVDGYQRAFYREFGCNPREYASHPTPIALFTPYRLLNAYAKKEKPMQETKTVFVQAVDKPARKALIKRGKAAEDYYQYCGEVGCDIWGYLLSIRQAVGEPVGLWLPQHLIREGTSRYVQGVELALEDTTLVPEGFDLLELPAATYLRFQGEPFAEEDYEEAIDEIWNAIKKYNPAACGYAWDETNPRIQLAPEGERGYIELLPVRKL